MTLLTPRQFHKRICDDLNRIYGEHYHRMVPVVVRKGVFQWYVEQQIGNVLHTVGPYWTRRKAVRTWNFRYPTDVR